MSETRVPQKWLLIAIGIAIFAILIIRAMFAGMEQIMHTGSPSYNGKKSNGLVRLCRP
jgi:hypothetical protein